MINHFVNRIKNGEAPVIDGKGEQSMDFIHVHDIARSVVLALTSEQANVPVNIGTGIDTSIADLARILIDAVGADVEPHLQPPRRARQPPRRRHRPAPRRCSASSRASRSRTGMADLIRQDG